MGEPQHEEEKHGRELVGCTDAATEDEGVAGVLLDAAVTGRAVHRPVHLQHLALGAQHLRVVQIRPHLQHFLCELLRLFIPVTSAPPQSYYHIQGESGGHHSLE